MMFLKVIACEIAFREITHLAAQSPHLIDLEFITQGLHDVPRAGAPKIQASIDAVPEGKYDAILLGYGLCGNLIRGVAARHTRLVVPRAHDCITFFLGSKERYAKVSEERTGCYFYTSGWLECLRRRGETVREGTPVFLPTRAGIGGNATAAFEQWVKKYGEERARYLVEQMDRWTEHYTHGMLIDFDFTKDLELHRRVIEICAQRGWSYGELPGDLSLLRHWLAGQWNESEFLIVPPGGAVMPSYDESIITAESPATAARDACPVAASGEVTERN